MQTKTVVKSIFLGAILFFSGRLHASSGQPIQQMGVDESTSVTIMVSTTPALMLSTGSNNPDLGNWTIPSFSTQVVRGQYLGGRKILEIINGSQNSVWIGNSSMTVSTVAFFGNGFTVNPNYGIEIPTRTARIVFDSFPFWWIAAGTTTTPVTIRQSR